MPSVATTVDVMPGKAEEEALDSNPKLDGAQGPVLAASSHKRLLCGMTFASSAGMTRNRRRESPEGQHQTSDELGGLLEVLHGPLAFTPLNPRNCEQSKSCSEAAELHASNTCTVHQP